MARLRRFCFLLAPLASCCFQTGPTDVTRRSNGNRPFEEDLSDLRSIDEAIREINSISLTRKSFLTSFIIGGAVVAASSQMTLAADTAPTVETQASDRTRQRTLDESLSGMVAGASLPVTKTLVKYPLDTATVRLQMPQSQYSIADLPNLLKGSYRGIAVPLLSNIPAGAVFFAVKDAVKEVLSGNHLPQWLSTSLAVGVAQIPYWLIRNPSEVVKTRQQAGVTGYDNTTWEAVVRVRRDSLNNRTNVPLWDGFYVGYWENILYAYPADVLKFVIYEQLAGGRSIPPAQGAIVGATATALAQFMTTPLDVVRNRLMARAPVAVTESQTEDTTGYFATLVGLAKTEGIPGLFAGVTPRVGKAMISGAIQFATYEETKQGMTKWLQKRQL